MRQALATKRPRGQRISEAHSWPAPVGGWNARDALAQMKQTDAIALENWFPKTSYVEMRGGRASHATGMTGNGKTLAVYNALSGTNRMFCATASGVYDVTSAGAVGASVAARTNGKHQWLNFGDGTNNYLIMVNGVDKPLYYNGTAWVAVDAASSPALTGLTTTEIIGLMSFKGRLMFLQKSSLSFWYLAAGVAGGALTEFDLSAQAVRGGYLMAMMNWSFDGGDGIDDYAVFVTSEGEVIVYRGTDPSTASAWLKVGTYYIGEPLGRRCLAKYGGDLLILTQNGVFPLSATLQSATIDRKMALSFKIENAFNDAGRVYGSIFGWLAVVYPAQSALIVNVPMAEDGTHHQYVMNTITKAWCKFTDWDAEDFAVFNEALYYTDATAVFKAWTGASDDGGNIVAYGKAAFSYFGRMGEQKRFTLYRPVLAINGTLSFLTDIDVDFKDDIISGLATYSASSAGTWDTSQWDSGAWASGALVTKEWTSPAEFTGYAAAAKIKVATNALAVQWVSNDIVFETGGVM